VDLEHVSALYTAHVAWLSAQYTEALAKAGFDAVVIHSGTPKKRSAFDDQFFPLRPTPELQRWAPLGDEGAYLVFEPGRTAALFWPENRSFWERPAAPEATFFLGVLDVKRLDAPELPPGKRVAFVGEDAAAAEKLGLLSAMNPKALLDAVDATRTRKTDYEIACLAEANRRASFGHEALRRAFESGDESELALHLMYLGATRQDDQETPYKNIVAAGRNAAVLHHVAYGRDPAKAESLLVDAGATCLGYCSDITRTWARPRGAAGETFAGLVDAMEAMQKRLVARVAIGMRYEELHDASHAELSALLVLAGIAKGTPEEIDARGVSRAFYPHGLGHSLGLQTHDVGCAVTTPRADNPFLRNTSRIEEGQVFTIEPGVYFIEGLLAGLRAKPEAALVDWNLVEALAPFGGIRIEDDLVVGERGVRNMTREVLPVGGATVRR
jgi:Xaa-Pro dipeptidase